MNLNFPFIFPGYDQNKASYLPLYIKNEPSPIQNGKELLQLNKIFTAVYSNK